MKIILILRYECNYTYAMIIIIINQNILSLMDRFAYLHLLCSDDVVSILVKVTHDVS